MYRSTSRWTTAVAAAALMALPVAAAAQSTPQQTTPPQQQTQPQQAPPQTQPPPMQPAPTQQPTQQPTTQPSQAAAGGQVDAAAAKQHLSEARDTLSQITSMPEATKLQGESRTQVSQLISNFNELITTQSNWRAAYGKVDANLTSLIGPDSADPGAAGGTAAASGTAGAVGTSGSAAAASLDPGIRAKLVEFRTHLKQFEEAAGGSHAGDAPNAMPPSAATGSTANPSNPAGSANPTDPSQPPSAAGATGTSGAAGAPTANMGAADQAKASEQVGHAEADKHLDAISAILNKSKTGTLTRTQTAELKKHVAELRRLLQPQQ